MKEIQGLLLDAVIVTTTGAGVEIDLRKYFVSPGKRELKATLAITLPVLATDSYVLDVKLQGSSTTVDTDFVDITGASFTQVNDGAAAFQEIHFGTSPIQPFIRTYRTITGANALPVVELFVTKRIS